MKANICGIYKIENELGEVYIGSANAKNGIAKRWSNHLSRLRKGHYEYIQLQDSWNRDVNNLKWEILEECHDNISEEDLSDIEKQWIKHCNMIDGWIVINKEQDNIKRRKPVADPSNMKKAQTGEKNGNNKYSIELIKSIKILIKESVPIKEISLKTGLSISYLYLIKNGYRWKNINL